jgi:hypothetical protein
VTSRRRRRSGRSTPWPEEDWTRENTIDRLRRFYEYRERRYAAQAGNIEDDGHEDRRGLPADASRGAGRAARSAAADAQRGRVSNEVMNRTLREFDLKEARLAV